MIGNMFRKAKTYVYLRAYLRNNLGDDMFVRYIAEKYPDVTFKICTSSKYAQPFVKQTNIKNISKQMLKQRYILEDLFLLSLKTLHIHKKFFQIQICLL